MQKPVKKIAASGMRDAIDTQACLELLIAGNTLEVAAALHTGLVSKTARPLIMLRKALLGRVLITVERAFQIPKRPKDDRHTRVAFDLLASKPALVDELAERGSREQLELAQHVWRLLSGSPKLEKLKHYRDKAVAHQAPLDPVKSPLIADLTSFASSTVVMWASLAKGVGIVSLDLQREFDAVREDAKAFWGAWRPNFGQ